MDMNVSKYDAPVICDIAKRFVALCAAQNPQHKPDILAVIMDISAAHLNGTPLRLSDLLAAKDSDFAHDVAGIRRHLNRETGAVELFSPRYGARKIPGNIN